MRNIKTKYQCFICKKEILTDEPREHELDPCSILISSNIDRELDERKEQTFFCHYDCFKQLNNDDSVLYLEELPTEREWEEENATIKEKLESFTCMLEEEANYYNIWPRLFEINCGDWIRLKDLISFNSNLLEYLNEIEEIVCEPLIISWMNDYSSDERSKSKVWRVILITTEGHYEYPVTLLLGFDRGCNKHSV